MNIYGNLNGKTESTKSLMEDWCIDGRAVLKEHFKVLNVMEF
jgi:hypothetical protein